MNETLTILELKNINQWKERYISAAGLISIINSYFVTPIKMLEIGTCRAENACKFLEDCPLITLLETVDPFLPFNDITGGINFERTEMFKQLAIKNLDEYKDRACLHQMTSENFFEQAMDKTYDVVFIDGNHDYDFVLNDLEHSFKLLNNGGIFSGHDWSLSTVNRAVTQFRLNHKITTPIQYTSNDVWFWLK